MPLALLPAERNGRAINRFYTARMQCRFDGERSRVMTGISQTADRPDLPSGAISVAAILLFVGIASSVLSQLVGQYLGTGEAADRLLIIALLLNVALILIGWRRHSELIGRVRGHAEAEARARDLAARDPLTGFHNRRSLADEGAAMLVDAERRHRATALLMLDLDHFKSVNDMHGHAIGDALLRVVAQEMTSITPVSALHARLGGDEFAIAMVFDPSAPEVVERVAERLVARLAQPIEAEGQKLHISCSLGIARSDFGCHSVEALMRAGDIAMYAAKKSGRNRFAWFDESMERDLRARNELEQGLRAAIPGGQIVPYFEQQVDLATGRLTGFEVLARWEHPVRGLIPPDRFIPIAEETGMIAELSLAIMRQAFACARDWDASLTLSVNISPWQLRDPWLAQKIIKTLTETGFPASRLEIEITESALFDNLALAQSIAGSLKNQGMRLALDDFGTGYSSLAHLRALPFDRIKIDKSFVTSINEAPDSAAIVTAIVRLGESLNLPVTAEGIEDAAIAERLIAMGCAKGQGWHYGKPLSMIGVRKLLAERHLITGLAAEADEAPAITSRRRAG